MSVCKNLFFGILKYILYIITYIFVNRFNRLIVPSKKVTLYVTSNLIMKMLYVTFQNLCSYSYLKKVNEFKLLTNNNFFLDISYSSILKNINFGLISKEHILVFFFFFNWYIFKFIPKQKFWQFFFFKFYLTLSNLNVVNITVQGGGQYIIPNPDKFCKMRSYGSNLSNSLDLLKALNYQNCIIFFPLPILINN